MPELPEVETSCSGIRPFCVDYTITNIIVRQPKLRWPVDPLVSSKLSGMVINKVERRGKYILLGISDFLLMIHLGMSGSLRVLDKTTEPGKHDHIDICLSNSKIIRYNDPRRFGCVILNQQGFQHPLLAKLGVEPLTEDFNWDYLYSLCRTRKIAIKALIMNSHIVVGVGNIYAQEALFRAGIKPQKMANKLSKINAKRLVEEIKLVLVEAIAAGGSSLKDFTSAEGKPGYFQQTLKVYGRGKALCMCCNTQLKQMLIGQRATVYCPKCQK